MSTPELVTVVVVALWLAVLSFVVLLLVRQLGLLTVLVRQGGPPTVMDYDGLEVGEKVPDDVLATLPLNGKPSYVLLLSTTCGPCRELAADLSGTDLGAPLIALISGSDELADAMVDMLPKNLHVVRDPEATAVAKSLRINSSPFALELETGTVTGKSYVNTRDDLLRLVNARQDQKELVAHGNG
ncbi:MAG TPA: hypothetical protein VHN37_14060 [Actinomycetota bacterium]|nr:hypothetical protein [Actinomycetota bacterium]